ncbi:hypothetical protein [Oceanobacillus damuensis]|uniref:hypothetical protein n=1 Tax=Oceanobacillus damuensis TaxID=937928 RepID=UPI000AC8F9C4|nr:hypothetical protein [Oceanobacillus damuensis]
MEIRKHASWYLKGMKRNGSVGKNSNGAETREELLGILYTIADKLDAEYQAS